MGSNRTMHVWRMSVAVTFSIALAGTGCEQSALPDPQFAVRVESECPEPTNESYFFTAESVYLKSDRLIGSWPSLQLTAMREPSLRCGEMPDSYRLLWLHSFSNWPPTMVRFTRDGERWKVIAVRLSSTSPRTEAERRDHLLTPGQADRMLGAISDFGFWRQHGFSSNPDVMDGAM
jgi:hypothetical protein